jgi:uncharacterized protein (DUF1330 family)
LDAGPVGAMALPDWAWSTQWTPFFSVEFNSIQVLNFYNSNEFQLNCEVDQNASARQIQMFPTG